MSAAEWSQGRPAGVNSGLVVASHALAAQAGADALRSGGGAVDAALCAAFALCVVDPANCGLGGYGGFLTYLPPRGEAVCVDFNTHVPARLSRADHSAYRRGTVRGGVSVAPPAVIPGLVEAHRRFGRLSLAELVAPAVRFAREGFAIGPDLARVLRSHWSATGGGRPEFATVFFPDRRPPAEGDRLVQRDLAASLELVAELGADALRCGLAEPMCAAAAGDGGFLRPEDVGEIVVTVLPAEQEKFSSASLYGPPPHVSGAGVLFCALAALKPSRLGERGGAEYARELGRALRISWSERRRSTVGARGSAQHTTHLCAGDVDGALVSLTLTHGPVWFGSGVMAPGTGLVLNAGANLFGEVEGRPAAVTNMTPVTIVVADGARHALGSPGGRRIPAIVFQAVVDVVHYSVSLASALAAPRLSVRSDGTLEGEKEALALAGRPEGAHVLDQASFFGAATGITRCGGRLLPALDPRFGCCAALA